MILIKTQLCKVLICTPENAAGSLRESKSDLMLQQLMAIYLPSITSLLPFSKATECERRPSYLVHAESRVATSHGQL